MSVKTFYGSITSKKYLEGAIDLVDQTTEVEADLVFNGTPSASRVF